MLSAFVVLCVAAASPHSPPYPLLAQETRDELTIAISDSLAGRRLPSVAGLSVGVLHHGQMFAMAQGETGSGRRATLQTPYRMASITKTMTAIVVMQLAGEGRLTIDDPVSMHVPNTPVTWKSITIRHLLNHSSGIPHYPRKGPERRLTSHLSTEQTLALITKKKLAFQPGKRFLYTTYGYDVLGAIIENIEGAPYDEVLRDRIFDPLFMTSMGVEDSRVRGDDWPDGLRLTRRGKVVKSSAIDLSSRFAGGGVRGAIVDLLPYADAILHHVLIDKHAFRAMTSPQPLLDGDVPDYGLGFAVYPQRGHLVVAHAGGQPETTTLLYMLPEHDLAIALATNLEGQGPALSAVAAAIVEVLIEGGVVRRDIATIDPKDAAITAAITRAMSWGAVTMHKDTLPTERGKKRANANDPALIDAAFTRFDAALSESALSKTALPKTTALIKELHLPKHGHSTLLVGAAVIRTVRDLNPTAFTELRAQGPLAVFAAYVEHCRKGEVPSSRRLSQALEEHIVRLSHAFTEAAPLSVRKLRKKDLKDVERTVALLSPMKGKDAHPDFTDDLVVASTSLLTARPRDAAALARLNVDLHPRSAIARLSLVEALLMLDDDDSARVLDDAWRRFGAASMPASLWLSRIVKLQHLASTGSARASVAAERLLHEAHKRFPNDATLVGDDDADEQ